VLQFCCKFAKVYVCQNYQNIMRFDKVIAPKQILFRIFKTGSSDIVSQCQEFFNFPEVSQIYHNGKLIR